jgi:hypothetical protein
MGTFETTARVWAASALVLAQHALDQRHHGTVSHISHKLTERHRIRVDSLDI